MVGKICPKTGKNKARHFCQAQFSPMKWAIFAILAVFRGARYEVRGYEVSFAGGNFSKACLSSYPRTSVPSYSHSHAAGSAQRGEDCRDDACKNLQECLPTFFLHSRLVFVLILRFLIRGEGLSHQTSAFRHQPSAISPQPSSFSHQTSAISSHSRCRLRRLREDWWCHHRPGSLCRPGCHSRRQSD